MMHDSDIIASIRAIATYLYLLSKKIFFFPCATLKESLSLRSFYKNEDWDEEEE